MSKKKEIFTKKYEKNMIENKILLDILNSIHSAVYIMDEKGTIIFVNHAVEEMDNVKAEDLIGKNVTDAYNDNRFDEDSESPSVMALRKNYYATDANLEWKSGGRVVNALTSVIPIMNNGIRQGIVTIADDYEEMKRRVIEHMEYSDRKSYSSNINNLENGTRYVFSDIIGNSSMVCNAIAAAKKFAVRDMPVMLYGETGTGKEMFAQSIHNESQYYKGPFVAVNCAAIPENLLESTLFGVKKGAFTGSTDSMGLFEKAAEGTLFLDEINSLPMAMQAKLLRALQEKEFQRVGDTIVRKLKCRIISATNDMPNTLIGKGKLREDLYYRLSTGFVVIPPLRSRGDDINKIITATIDRLNKEYGMVIIGLTPELNRLLHGYSWPGNVRELVALLERAFNLANEKDGYLGIEHLMSYERQKIQEDIKAHKKEVRESVSVTQDTGVQLYIEKDINYMVDEYERTLIEKALTQTGGKLSKSSELLGISRQALAVKMKKFNIDKNVFKPQK